MPDQLKMLAEQKATATVRLGDIKDSDEWGNMASRLGWGEAEREKFLEYGEYADLVLVVRKDGAVVGGRLVPRKTESFEFLVNETPVDRELMMQDIVFDGAPFPEADAEVLRQLLHEEIYAANDWAGRIVVPTPELHGRRARALALVMRLAGVEVDTRGLEDESTDKEG